MISATAVALDQANRLTTGPGRAAASTDYGGHGRAERAGRASQPAGRASRPSGSAERVGKAEQSEPGRTGRELAS